MKNKKEKLVVILLVVGLIVATVAISYAAFRFTGTGSVLNQITTGSITMSYTESSNVISMTGALPTTDATGKTRLNEGEYFDFTVGSSITGTANINYEIAAQELDGNTIDGSYIKYYLTKVNEDNSEEEVMSPKTYTEESSANEYTGRPANMMSLYTGSMSSTTTTKYRLRLYIDESYNPQGDGGNLVYKVRVNVYGLSGDEVEEGLAPGLYDAEGNMTYSWEELLNTEISYYDSDGNQKTTKILIIDENGVLTTTIDGRSGCSASMNILVGKLIIADSVTSIGEDAFYVCNKLTSVIISNSVTSIGRGAFGECSELISIEMSNSIINIGEGAFNTCYNFKTINYNGTKEQWNSITFDSGWNDKVSDFTVHCTDGDIVIPGV